MPDKSHQTAFALLPSEQGPVLVPPADVSLLLKADWALFLELAAYSLHGGTGHIAFGVEEVTEAESQSAIAVLFVMVSCGHGGEAAVRRVAAAGGRGYILGMTHELHGDVEKWGAAAILHRPLLRLQTELFEPEKRLKGATPKGRVRPPVPVDNAVLATTAKAPAPVVMRDEGDVLNFTQADPTKKNLRHELRNLGTVESLKDKTAIPKMAASVCEKFLPALHANEAFGAFADVFMATKVVAVAHRKALLYVVHEILKSKEVMAVGGRIPGCVRFLLMVGAIVSGFSEEEKRSYTRILSVWEKTQVFDHEVILRIREAWGM